jgi:poly-gamma-glutamate capsule biosynthesis protein CapA/YwtB (metallophosphatase superfamily)
MAHEATDQGVDMGIGHGSHRSKGIKIYQGKLIFPRLGDVILQNDTQCCSQRMPTPATAWGWHHRPSDFYCTQSRNATIAQDIIRDNWQRAVAVLH